MVNAIPQGSTIYGVLIGEFEEGSNRVVNPVIGIENFSAQMPASVIVAKDTVDNYIWSADVYGNLSHNDWEPSEELNVTLASALNAKISGVNFTPGGSNVLDDPDMVFSI